MEITNRALVDFGFTLGQIKTWASLVLGRDPEADQGGGVARRYDLDSAFKIYLCGILVAVYRMGLKQAQGNILALWPYLEEKGLLPSSYRYMKDFRSIEIICFAQHNFEIRWLISRKFPAPHEVIYHYRDEFFTLGDEFEKVWPAYFVAYSHYLQRFLKKFGVLVTPDLQIYPAE